MSQFTVTPDSVATAGTRISGIATDIDRAHGLIQNVGGAAAGTPAAAALEDLLDHLGAVIPSFSTAGRGLSLAVSGAAASYGETEVSITTAAKS